MEKESEGYHIYENTMTSRKQRIRKRRETGMRGGGRRGYERRRGGGLEGNHGRREDNAVKKEDGKDRDWKWGGEEYERGLEVKQAKD